MKKIITTSLFLMLFVSCSFSDRRPKSVGDNLTDTDSTFTDLDTCISAIIKQASGGDSTYYAQAQLEAETELNSEAIKKYGKTEGKAEDSKLAICNDSKTFQAIVGMVKDAILQLCANDLVPKVKSMLAEQLLQLGKAIDPVSDYIINDYIEEAFVAQQIEQCSSSVVNDVVAELIKDYEIFSDLDTCKKSLANEVRAKLDLVPIDAEKELYTIDYIGAQIYKYIGEHADVVSAYTNYCNQNKAAIVDVIFNALNSVNKYSYEVTLLRCTNKFQAMFLPNTNIDSYKALIQLDMNSYCKNKNYSSCLEVGPAFLNEVNLCVDMALFRRAHDLNSNIVSSAAALYTNMLQAKAMFTYVLATEWGRLIDTAQCSLDAQNKKQVINSEKFRILGSQLRQKICKESACGADCLGNESQACLNDLNQYVIVGQGTINNSNIAFAECSIKDAVCGVQCNQVNPPAGGTAAISIDPKYLASGVALYMPAVTSGTLALVSDPNTIPTSEQTASIDGVIPKDFLKNTGTAEGTIYFVVPNDFNMVNPGAPMHKIPANGILVDDVKIHLNYASDGCSNTYGMLDVYLVTGTNQSTKIGGAKLFGCRKAKPPTSAELASMVKINKKTFPALPGQLPKTEYRLIYTPSADNTRDFRVICISSYHGQTMQSFTFEKTSASFVLTNTYPVSCTARVSAYINCPPTLNAKGTACASAYGASYMVPMP